MRITDILHGLVPEELPANPDLESFVEFVELDPDGEHTVRDKPVRGSTGKRYHLFSGDEAQLELAVAVLPAHTRRWYHETMENIADNLWDYDHRRDLLLIQAIQRTFKRSDEEAESEMERLLKIR